MNLCAAVAYLGLNICSKQAPVSSIVEQSFVEHLSAYGISYGTTEEYNFRLDLFAAKDAEITRINSNPENTFTLGHNFMSTWTKDEY